MDDNERLLTAVDRGADVVITRLALGERDTDLVGLVADATRAALVNPDVTLSDVLDECYPQASAEVLDWWGGWE